MKVLVLASGGLDSTVLLHKAVKKYGAYNVHAVSIYYGQKHHREIESFYWQVRHLGIENYSTYDLSSIFHGFTGCTLLQDGLPVPSGTYEEQKAVHKNISTYVPFRNGLFLSVAASIALQNKCDKIWYGAHKDDTIGTAYPDCSQEFVLSMEKAIREGTGGQVLLEAPWIALTKAEIVAEGIQLGMTKEVFTHTWSCYNGQDNPCKTCATCLDRKKAFVANNIDDIE